MITAPARCFAFRTCAECSGVEPGEMLGTSTESRRRAPLASVPFLDAPMTALYFASVVLKIRSFLSSRATSTLVGISTTCNGDLDEPSLGLGGTGHAGELVVEAEVVLGDRRA
jgi:hypothetical protein